MRDGQSKWLRRLNKFADWDFALQIAFIIVMFVVAALLVHLGR